MKYRDLDGQFKEITIKTSDTLPVGSVVEYNGSTPPTGWSKVSDHDGNVIVSSEEPTTGEEVWLEKGKNLYNPKNTYVSGGNSQNVIFTYKGIEVGKTYTFSAPNYSWLNVSFHNASGTFIRSIDGYESIKELTFTIQENEAYIGLTFYSGRENLISTDDIDFTGVQLEQGEIATPYEPFKPKKVHTKNDNGVYEEFYNEEDTGWITLTLASGLEAVSGQYLKARKKNGIVNIMGTLKLSNVSWNKRIADLPTEFKPMQEINFVCRGLDTGEDAHIIIINTVGRIGYLSGVNKATAGQTVMFNICATYIAKE